MKKLVAYFSATGTTKRLAERLAQAANADLFEIKPKTPYTAADLDWTNKKSRSSLEMKDKSSRPPVAEKLADATGYDTVFVGFPIWWYVAPTIVNSFLEQYDLSGKKIVPFATSGGSGMGNTNRELECSCPGATLVEGRCFNADTDAASLKAWIESLPITEE